MATPGHHRCARGCGNRVPTSYCTFGTRSARNRGWGDSSLSPTRSSSLSAALHIDHIPHTHDFIALPNLAQLTGYSGSSFPSGHAAASAASFVVFALLLGRRRSNTAKALLGGVAVGLAVAVASTRVLLGVHWFTDVLAGLFVGWAWFSLVSIAFGGRVLRFGRTLEVTEAALPDPPR